MSETLISNLEAICKDDFDVEDGPTRFRKCAEFLMNQCILETSQNKYRFTEIEFYKYSSKHPDGFCHNHKTQEEMGKWYFHPYNDGVDITFGDRSEKVFGGILVRGIRRDKVNDDPICGPTMVLAELLGTFKDTSVTNGNGILRIANVLGLDKIDILETPRIGIQKMKREFSEREIFLKANYRFKAIV